MKIFTVSKLTRRDEAQWAYVVHWATHPDKASTFARATCLLRLLPRGLLFFLLVRCLRYDGIICYDDGFVGHVFFQKHRRHWGIFSVFVWENLRHRGYAKRMIAECLKMAYLQTRIIRVYIGNGGHPDIQHIAELAQKNQFGLSFPLRAGTDKGEVIVVRPVPNDVVRHQLSQSLRKF